MTVRTIAAVLAITFQAVNDQPPAVTLALPPDYVRQLMEGFEAALAALGATSISLHCWQGDDVGGDLPPARGDGMVQAQALVRVALP